MLSIRGSDSTKRFPHDLVHFVVESYLNFDWGFWGMIDKGASFDTVTVIERPKGARRRDLDKRLIALHKDEIVEAEYFTGCVDDLWKSGSSDAMGVVEKRLKTAWSTDRETRVTAESVRQACASLDRLSATWFALPPENRLTFKWDPGRPLQQLN